MKNCIAYIGDFDLRNENVQAHLVSNNVKILNNLGYHIEYIGINRKESSFKAIALLPSIQLDGGNQYLELPNTLSSAGLLKIPKVCKLIISKLNELKKVYNVLYVITYQSPSYAVVLKEVAKWCKRNNVYYIVNCADIPIFDLQLPLRKCVMKANWEYMHKINRRYANGIIAVSKYVENFYSKKGRPSIIVPPLFDILDVELKVEPNEIPTFIYAGTPFKITGQEAAPEGMKDRLDKVIDLFLSLSVSGTKYIFNIVGITKEDYLTGVPRHTAALIKESKIRFLGKHSHNDTLGMIAASDFSINYRDENIMTKAGFSTKIVESISLGTAVIINDISDTFVYLENGVSGFEIFASSTESIKVLMSLCNLSADERMRIKEKCITLNPFYWENYLSVFDEFLKSVYNTKQ